MRDHTKLRAFELVDEVALLIYRDLARRLGYADDSDISECLNPVNAQ